VQAGLARPCNLFTTRKQTCCPSISAGTAATARQLLRTNNTHIETMTIPLYPDIVTTLSPGHGGSEVDDLCQQIHDATKGWGVRYV
jgi:hypothetical protein